MSDYQKPAFEVIDGATGHRFQVWADGRINGFGSASVVVNRIPPLVRRAVAGASNLTATPFREFAAKRNGCPWPCITLMERYDDSILRMMDTCADYMDELRGKR